MMLEGAIRPPSERRSRQRLSRKPIFTTGVEPENSRWARPENAEPTMMALARDFAAILSTFEGFGTPCCQKTAGRRATKRGQTAKDMALALVGKYNRVSDDRI